MWMKSRHVITLTLVWFTVTLGSASAEWFVDLYGGGGFTQDSAEMTHLQEATAEQDCGGRKGRR